jgi:hypothetical protein
MTGGRALDYGVQELDHFPGLNRARIAVRPVGKLLLKDSLRIFWVFTALAQVPLGEVLDQRRHVMGIAGGRYVDRGEPGAGSVHGAARIDPFL